MVSRYMVLFGITDLRLGIFIAWWMSIFQSTVILWHFVFQFDHHHILGHTPFVESTRPFIRLSFTFWFGCWPLRVAYWGIPSFFGIIGHFTGFIIFWPSCRSSWVVILGHIPSYRVCLHCSLSYHLALGHLIRSFILLVWVRVFRDRTYIDRSFILPILVLVFGTAPILIGHFHVSPVFKTAPISISHRLVSLSLSF